MASDMPKQDFQIKLKVFASSSPKWTAYKMNHPAVYNNGVNNPVLRQLENNKNVHNQLRFFAVFFLHLF